VGADGGIHFGVKQVDISACVHMFRYSKISHLTNEMLNIYSTAVVTDDRGRSYRLDELSDVLTTSRDYDRLEWAWLAWRDATGPSIKPLYMQLVDGMNRAALDNGNHGNTALLVINISLNTKHQINALKIIF